MLTFLKKTFALIAIGTVFYFTATPTLFVFANEPTPYVVLEPLPGTFYEGENCLLDANGNPVGGGCETDLRTYVPGMFKLLIGVAAALAVIMIMIGGVQYIGSESLWGKQDGKEKIQKAIWGLLLAIFAYLLLYTINPRLLEFDLSIPEAEFPQAPDNTDQYTLRIGYGIVNTGGMFIDCRGAFASEDACENGMDEFGAGYPEPPYIVRYRSCVQSCSPVRPPTEYFMKVTYRIGNQTGPPLTACYRTDGPALCQINLGNLNSSSFPPNWNILGKSCAATCQNTIQGGLPTGPAGYWIRVTFINQNNNNEQYAYPSGPYTSDVGLQNCHFDLNTFYPGPFPMTTANGTEITAASCVFVD